MWRLQPESWRVRGSRRTSSGEETGGCNCSLNFTRRAPPAPGGVGYLRFEEPLQLKRPLDPAAAPCAAAAWYDDMLFLPKRSALVTFSGSRASTGGGDHLRFDGSHARLPPDLL
ncbi:hypothetical protein EVAR_2880_1 [Eumeta japonica]|uniref:Uncharacterized protein n=1 Tax=Eumeta variegata TaxID=151549 RepID=A0A4C1T482_EUMVA|nr:hypothetical protein EVAR_2880_1 [Eumeta japonica]